MAEKEIRSYYQTRFEPNFNVGGDRASERWAKRVLANSIEGDDLGPTIRHWPADVRRLVLTGLRRRGLRLDGQKVVSL